MLIDDQAVRDDDHSVRRNCPSEHQLRAFLLGDLCASLLEQTAEHLDSCLYCEDRARRLDGIHDAILAAIAVRPPATGEFNAIEPRA